MITRLKGLIFSPVETPLASPITPKPVQIYFNKDKTLFFDENDACMNAVVRSYNIGNDIKVQCGLNISGPQIALWLNDLNPVQLVLNANEPVISSAPNKEFILTYCAMKSILLKLLHAGCIEQDALMFQMRVRGDLSGPLQPIFLGEEINSIPFCGRGTATHTFVYLDSGYMSIFLNRNITQEKINQIETVLAKICPENNPLLEVEGSPQRMLR